MPTKNPPDPSENRIVDRAFLQQHIFNHFRKVMKGRGMNLSMLAKRLGYSVPYISGIFSGKESMMSMVKYQDIAHSIGMSDAELDVIIIQAKQEEMYMTHSRESLRKSLIREAPELEYVLRNTGAMDDAMVADIMSYIGYKISIRDKQQRKGTSDT